MILLPMDGYILSSMNITKTNFPIIDIVKNQKNCRITRFIILDRKQTKNEISILTC